MPAIESLRLLISCPSCDVPQALTASWTATPAEGGAAHAVLRECTRCWARRARALNDARQKLREDGELVSSGPWTTWRGELLDDAREHDGLAAALLSELLRRDVPAIPWARLSLPADVGVEATAQEA